MADKPQPEKTPAPPVDVYKAKALAIYAEKYGADKARDAVVEHKGSGKTEVLYWIGGVPVKVKKG